MNINHTTDLENSKVTLASNSPVKMPSVFGKTMQKYYKSQIEKTEKELNEAHNEFSEYANLLNQNVNNEEVKADLLQAQVKAETKIEKASEKLAKFYEKYDGISNKVTGFNKSKLNKELAKELSVELDKNIINPSQETTAFVDPTIQNSEDGLNNILTANNLELNNQTVEPVLPSAPAIDLTSVPAVDTVVPTVEPIQPTEESIQPVVTEEPSIESEVTQESEVEENQVSGKVEEFTKYVTNLEKDNKELKGLLEESKKTIDEQKNQVDALKQENESLKQELEKMKQQNVVTPIQPVVTPIQPAIEPVAPVNTNQPVFMQYTNRINQANSKEQLNSIKYELNTQRANLNLADIQFKVLMGNIDNALKRFDMIQPNTVQDVSFVQPSVVQSAQQGTQDISFNPFVQPVTTPNIYLDYSSKVANAVNKASINELVQLQSEIKFVKNQFTEEQYNSLMNNVNNGIKSLNPTSYSL